MPLLSTKVEGIVALLGGGLLGLSVYELWGIWALAFLVAIELELLWVVNGLLRETT